MLVSYSNKLPTNNLYLNRLIAWQFTLFHHFSMEIGDRVFRAGKLLAVRRCNTTHKEDAGSNSTRLMLLVANPDTDSICAAISLCISKTKSDSPIYEVRRAGTLNRETTVLNAFEERSSFTTVTPQIKDAEIQKQPANS